MHCQVRAAVARQHGWHVHLFDAGIVETQASVMLGEWTTDVLYGPAQRWDRRRRRDHGVALAATVAARSQVLPCLRPAPTVPTTLTRPEIRGGSIPWKRGWRDGDEWGAA